MAYLIDRQRALRLDDVVAVLKVRQRRSRSRVILSDNSLYHTLTRPQTLIRRTRYDIEETQAATWRKQQ